MADYPNSRNDPPNHLETGGGTGFFWALLVVAVLGVLVLVGGLGGGSSADPVTVAPADGIVLPDTGTTIVQ